MILDDKIVRVTPTIIGHEIYTLDVPQDSIIIEQLEKWRKSIDWEDAFLSTGNRLGEYEQHDDAEEIIENHVSENHLHKVMSEDDHSWDFGTSNLVELNFESNYHDKIYSTIKKYLHIEGFNYDHPSGCFWYPPTGYMSWHTNADNGGYRVYANWVPEDNKSFIRLRDPNTGNIITSWDKKGWQFRMFLCKEEPAEDVTWHCIYSDTNRLSLGCHFYKDGESSNMIKS